MNEEKVLQLASMYIEYFTEEKIQPQCMDIDKTPPSTEDWLPHAHYLALNVLEFIKSGRIEKAKHHLTACQMCLLGGGVLSISDLMEDNSKDPV